MNGRQVGYVFFFFAVAITIAAAQNGYVSFSGTTVTLTCNIGDTDDGYEWFKDKTFQPNKTDSSLVLDDYNDKSNGMYSCKYGEKTHYFYIHAKVCEGCYDMNMILAFGIIFGDVLFTLGIVLLIYFCCKNKEAAAPQRAAKQRQARGPGRGPPVPEADYQPLNPATRSNDIYAQAHR
ncbi:T-cell surface glycoprotein CD3 epsilon chain-like [Silurus meridionalis]|uniref:Ig-like domain-containing protein n=1 Tax=Silurus meridionalis TaxID=175797 RepID=A0A8T0B537_SILME|nr:T-cell surface glycoprotein CD3 epsilon chain-like [Silurus meridionalis]KAF7699702.1 hypothetical protein HF521_002660 [Silurus meridionalis]